LEKKGSEENLKESKPKPRFSVIEEDEKERKENPVTKSTSFGSIENQKENEDEEESTKKKKKAKDKNK